MPFKNIPTNWSMFPGPLSSPAVTARPLNPNAPAWKMPGINSNLSVNAPAWTGAKRKTRKHRKNRKVSRKNRK